ncbi:hypothetical protein I4U23_024143 [Adineta vaga]|nr:hypothetical protein I4U23_024143 [Adineta vaga]
MPGRHGKATVRKIQVRQTSPEIPSPVKLVERKTVDENIENQMPIDEIETQSSDSLPPPSTPPTTTTCVESKTDVNPMAILFANGHPLLTNFEEKYLIDLILKSPTKDIEVILEEKIRFILQMNYGSHSSLFKLNIQWIFDFLLKHFQTLTEHMNSRDLFEKFLKKNFPQNNSIIASKHWQLQTLINEHSKKQSTNSQKRRMTVRHIDLN